VLEPLGEVPEILGQAPAMQEVFRAIGRLSQSSATVLMFGPIALLALQGKAGLPKWLGVVTLVAFVEQFVETITIFGRTGFIAPGGPMNLALGAWLTAIAFVCTGIAVAGAARDRELSSGSVRSLG